MKDLPKPRVRRWITAAVILLLLGLFSFFAAGIVGMFISSQGIEYGNVAVIKIRGPIMVDSSSRVLSDKVTSSSEVIGLLEKAEENPEVIAIILDINSPGGGAVASYEIAEAVEGSNKTVVAWIREVGASGAYWIASAAEYVVVNPVSITGSIGVISSYLDFSGFIQDHNVSYERLVSGEHKDIGVPFRELTDEERDIFQNDLDLIRMEFVKGVAENRDMTVEEVDAIATGQFFLGTQAKDLGLVDKLGGKEDAIRYIENKHDIEVELAEYKTHKSFSELLSEIKSPSITVDFGQDSMIRT